MKTQIQMFYEAHRKNSDANELFLEFVREGLTAPELKQLIERRPALWSRFGHWIEKLPQNRVEKGTK